MQILHLDRPLKVGIRPPRFLPMHSKARPYFPPMFRQATEKIGALNNPPKFETIDTTIITVFPTPVSGTMFAHQFPNWVSP